MNTFWLKMVGFAVVVVAVVVIVKTLPPSEPKPEPKTVYDIWEEDEKELRADAEFDEPNEDLVEVEVEPAPKDEPKVVVKKQEPVKPQFRELSEEEEVEAQRLFEFALSQRKIGRLPVTGFKPMVDACRKIITKFPDSVYAFKAKRMLGDIPKRYRRRYKITDEEIDLGNLK